MNIGIIMGGVSSEREITFKIGRDIIQNIDKSKYNVKEIIIDSPGEVFEKIKGIDFAFLALAGRFGEDGKIQSLLESMNIPYSGSGVLTSGICMNKNISKTILSQNNIYTPNWMLIKNISEINYDWIEKTGFPIIVKPNDGGSSIGTFLITDINDIELKVIEALKYSESILIEEYIEGEEYSTFVLNREVLPSINIKTKALYDYNSKYIGEGTKKEVIKIHKSIETSINEVAKKCWDILECEVYVRIDIIVKEGVPYILEINTLPSIHDESLISKIIKYQGISKTKLIDTIIELSLKIKR